jgi:hypothetical protein
MARALVLIRVAGARLSVSTARLGETPFGSASLFQLGAYTAFEPIKSIPPTSELPNFIRKLLNKRASINS